MDAKKKRKNYFSNKGSEYKKRKGLTLECGMKGFFCTCNFREKDCVREAYNLLNEYAEKIYGSKEKQPETVDSKTKTNKDEENEEKEKVEVEEEKVKTGETKGVEEEKETTVDKEEDKKEENVAIKEKEENREEEDEEDEDISTALNNEINDLKAEAVKPPRERQFQVVDTGVDNVIFIKSTVPDTLEIVTAIVNDLHETKKQKTRYLLRMLPIQVTCKAYLDDIKVKADTLFEKYFAQEPRTFCIVFNRHSNSNLHRSEVIEDLAQIIAKKNPGNKANLKNPDIAVVVEVVRAVCLISIAPNYFTYKKYNLLEISNLKKD